MNYHDILGVPRTATLDDINRAYRKKAMKCHPDRGGTPESFSQLQEAYNNLTDALKNTDTSDYDWGFGFDFDDDDDEDEFSTTIIPQNQDLTIKVHISLERSYNGGTIETRYELLSGKFQTVELDVPQGIKSNQTIQYTGFGDDSVPLTPRGNLIVTFIVEPHDSFLRRNDDLCTSVTISAIDAMIGTTVVINGLDGDKYEITIAPGTQPNHEIIVDNYGFLNTKKRKTGNFIVIILVEIVPVTDISIIKKLKQINQLINN